MKIEITFLAIVQYSCVCNKIIGLPLGERMVFFFSVANKSNEISSPIQSQYYKRRSMTLQIMFIIKTAAISTTKVINSEIIETVNFDCQCATNLSISHANK